MRRKAPVWKGQRRLFAALLLIAAAVMLFLAWQSLSTDQYKLYDRNYDYYVSEAAKCRDMEDSALGAHYAYLAGEWEETAQMAGAYLTQHRAGAASLGVVCLVCLALSVRLLLDDRRRRTKDDALPGALKSK